MVSRNCSFRLYCSNVEIQSEARFETFVFGLFLLCCAEENSDLLCLLCFDQLAFVNAGAQRNTKLRPNGRLARPIHQRIKRSIRAFVDCVRHICLTKSKHADGKAFC